MTQNVVYLFSPMAAPLDTMPNRIRAIRKDRDMSAEQLGKLVGLTKSAVGLIERGERRLTHDMMRRFAGPLGVDPADLLHPSDNPNALSEEEKRHLANYRALDARGRRTVAGVAENLRDWGSSPDTDEARKRA